MRERWCEKKFRILPPSYVTPGSTIPLVCFSTCTAKVSQLLAKLYLLIVSLNKSLKRNKLESQCRYHKCIIEQKQTKVTNLLVDSDVKTSKQNSVTNFKIVKQCYGLHGLSKCITAGKATDKQLWKENLSSRLVEHQHIRKPIFVMRFWIWLI